MRLLLLVIGFSCFCSSTAQNWKPTEWLDALNNKTRTHTGLPGPAYWQNHASYKIQARLDTDASLVTGSAQIHYFNESPDTLNRMVMRLYGNFYKRGISRNWPIGDEDLHDGMLLKKISFVGVKAEKLGENIRPNGTNFTIQLIKGLLPGDSCLIEVEWELQIPQKRWARMGNYGHNRFFVAYWYPQIAVYDDISGWDMVNYEGIAEFYNDFNDFDVEIEVPEGYGVWATGQLMDAEAVLGTDVYRQYQKALLSDERVLINDHFISDKKRSRTKKWRFVARSVPDFSFAAAAGSRESKIIWEGAGLTVDSASGRRVLVDVVYPEAAPNYKEIGLSLARSSVAYLSFKSPGVAYPYPHMTTFCNGRSGGGMETPMMANNGAPDDVSRLAVLVFHEIAHSYFPFSMGTNERKYAWMDEGWAAMLPYAFMDSLYPENHYINQLAEIYTSVAGSEQDLPPMVSSYNISDYVSVRNAAYNRPAMAYYQLETEMGREFFRSFLNRYYQVWSGKHPVPADFFNLLEEFSGKDLSWWYGPWFFQYAYPDVSLLKLSDEGWLQVENKGGIPLAFAIELKYTDGEIRSKVLSASDWAGQTIIAISIERTDGLQSVEIIPELPGDIFPADNLWEFEN